MDEEMNTVVMNMFNCIDSCASALQVKYDHYLECVNRYIQSNGIDYTIDDRIAKLDRESNALIKLNNALMIELTSFQESIKPM